MNIKSSIFYTALAACLGIGYGGGVAVTQHDIDRAHAAAKVAFKCEDTEAARQFRAPQPTNSAAQGF